MRSVVTLLLLAAMAWTGTGAFSIAQRAVRAAPHCCCAASGHACRCTGPCCDHGDRSAPPAADGRLHYDASCGVNTSPPGTVVLHPAVAPALPRVVPPAPAAAPQPSAIPLLAYRDVPPGDPPPRSPSC